MGTSQSVYTPRRNRNHLPRNRRDPHDEYHHEKFRNPEFRGGDEHTTRRRDEDYAARRGEEDYAARRPDRDVSRREGFERRRVDHQGYRDVEDDARSHLVQNRVDRARMYRQDQGRHPMATGPICFGERIRSTPIPPHFRIAQGVEKYGLVPAFWRWLVLSRGLLRFLERRPCSKAAPPPVRRMHTSLG